MSPGQEVYYIKKQDQLLQETQNVIPDTQKRLNAAYHDLKTLVETEVTLSVLCLGPVENIGWVSGVLCIILSDF